MIETTLENKIYVIHILENKIDQFIEIKIYLVNKK